MHKVSDTMQEINTLIIITKGFLKNLNSLNKILIMLFLNKPITHFIKFNWNFLDLFRRTSLSIILIMRWVRRFFLYNRVRIMNNQIVIQDHKEERGRLRIKGTHKSTNSSNQNIISRTKVSKAHIPMQCKWTKLRKCKVGRNEYFCFFTLYEMQTHKINPIHARFNTIKERV